MDAALKDGHVQPTEVEYINAHGTSTQLNDKIETKAIKSVFGEHAYKMKLSSIKSMIGHSLGAAGGIEAMVTLPSCPSPPDCASVIECTLAPLPS